MAEPRRPTGHRAAGGEGLLEIGRIVRPHGLRGEVVVAPTTNRHERFEPGSVHACDRGDLVVAAARRHQGRWVVAYESIADRTAAETYRDVVLRAEPLESLDEGAFWVHELVGAEVVDRAGAARGRVVSVEANPAHDILVLDTGALVPVVFVSEVDASPGEGRGRVVVDAPDGLFDPEFVEANRAGVERRKGGGKAARKTRTRKTARPPHRER